MKKTMALALRIILLIVIMLISMTVSSLAVGVTQTSQSSNDSIMQILIYCLLNTLIVTWFIVKSELRGYKLVVVIFIIFFGVQYFMTQIETLYFNNSVKMPISQIIKVVAYGAIYTAVFSLLAVLILGKFSKQISFQKDDVKIKFPIKNILPNMIILSLIYVIIYFAFGYFVAWQFADLRYFYTGSTDMVNIFQHMSNQFKQDPILILFQFFRGFLWSAFALIIIYSLSTKKWATYMTTGLLFSILITTPLIFSNAYMPASVRLAHSIELSTSMLTFGVISVIIFKAQFFGDSK